MTYAKSNSIQATDFNSLAGTTNALAPYASTAAATQKVAALWGIGYGDRGYGQTLPTLDKKTVGNPNELLWLCTPSGDGNGDGGWNTSMFTVDNTKKYRSSVWFRVKESNSSNGRFYHGLDGGNAIRVSDNVADTNPYWHYPTSTELNPGQWYLSVGILHEAGYTGGQSGLSGIYDIHGRLVYASNDFKQVSGVTSQRQRVYHYYDSTTTQRQWMARPRWEMITGSEPSISTLVSAPWETVKADTMIAPSQWVRGTSGTQGMFGNNDTVAGESSIIQANASGNIQGPTGSILKAQDFLDLRSAIATIASYQGTATTLLPPTTEFAAGGLVKAEVPATTAYDFPTMIANIDNNRLIAAAANMSVTAGSLTVTRSTTWGGGTGGIVCEITAAFSSEDSARYFFNAGGTINVVLAHPNTSTTQDQNWNSILSALGTIKIGARATTRTGSGGTPQSQGYYTLTTAYQTVFDGTNIGTGAYSANDVLIEAMAVSVAGVNGGNGTTVQIRVTLTDQHTNSFSDLVQSGTNASLGFTKAASILSGIASPTFATVTNF